MSKAKPASTRRPRRFTEDEIIAYHEAGHAVVAQVLQVKFVSVSTRRGKRNGGGLAILTRSDKVKKCNGYLLPKSSDRLLYRGSATSAVANEKYIMVFLGGSVAKSTSRALWSNPRTRYASGSIS